MAVSMAEPPSQLPEDHFNDLIGLVIYVDCKSWNSKFARETWGADFEMKKTPGLIKGVKLLRKTKEPSFEIYFEDTKQLVGKIDLDYVLKYSDEIPLKYHRLKAAYIVRKSVEASAAAKPPSNTADNVVNVDETSKSKSKPVSAVVKGNSTAKVSTAVKKKAPQQRIRMTSTSKQKKLPKSIAPEEFEESEIEQDDKEDDETDVEDFLDDDAEVDHDDTTPAES